MQTFGHIFVMITSQRVSTFTFSVNKRQQREQLRLQNTSPTALNLCALSWSSSTRSPAVLPIGNISHLNCLNRFATLVRSVAFCYDKLRGCALRLDWTYAECAHVSSSAPVSAVLDVFGPLRFGFVHITQTVTTRARSNARDAQVPQHYI